MPNQGMDPLLKDWIQVIQWSVAIVGGLIAAGVAIYQLRANTKQRERELRFKQAEAGKEILEELFRDDESKRALEMLDFKNNYFKNEKGEEFHVSSQDIPKALKNANEKEDARTVLIVRSFDALFYSLNLFEHFITVELTTEEDVSIPMEYYANRLAKNKSVYVEYIQNNTYPKALIFLNRFSDWRESRA